jgi:hypothetical protein
MSAIDFPNSPTIGDIFPTDGDRQWRYAGDGVWQTVTTQKGNQGDKGGLRYDFDTSTTLADPATGKIRFNNSTIGSVSSIAISSLTIEEADVSDYFVALSDALTSELSVIKYYMVINSNLNDDSTYAIFAITDVTNNGTWLELDADYISGTLPENNDTLAISLNRVGDVGPTGPETSIAIGTVTTSLPGEDAEVSVTGPAGDQTLNFVLPQGPTGPETSISVGTVTTGSPGGTSEVSVTGPAGDQELSFTIPQGPTGPGGTYSYQVSPTAPEGVNPEGPDEGDTWFNAETGRFYIYYDGYWIENTSSLVGPGGSDANLSGISATYPLIYDNENYIMSLDEEALGSGSITVSETAPEAPEEGDLWFNSTNTIIYIFFDGFWIESSPSQPGPTGPTGNTGPSGVVTTTLPITNSGTSTSANIGIDYSVLQYGQNAIINGAFDIWQRGTSFSTPANGSYTADRSIFINNGSGAVYVISRENNPIGSDIGGSHPDFFYRYSQTTAGTGATLTIPYAQRVENARAFAGQTVTVSAYIKTDAPRIANFEFSIGVGSGGSGTPAAVISPTFTTSTSWQRYTFTTTISNLSGVTLGTGNAMSVVIRGEINTTQIFDIWGVQLELGSEATPFRRNAPSIQAELAACQRYYQKSYNLASSAGTITSVGRFQWFASGTNSFHQFPIILKTSMRSSPTVRLYSPNTGTIDSIRNITSSADVAAAATSIGENSFIGEVNNVSINGAFLAFHYTAESEI